MINWLARWTLIYLIYKILIYLWNKFRDYLIEYRNQNKHKSLYIKILVVLLSYSRILIIWIICSSKELIGNESNLNTSLNN